MLTNAHHLVRSSKNIKTRSRTCSGCRSRPSIPTWWWVVSTNRNTKSCHTWSEVSLRWCKFNWAANTRQSDRQHRAQLETTSCSQSIKIHSFILIHHDPERSRSKSTGFLEWYTIDLTLETLSWRGPFIRAPYRSTCQDLSRLTICCSTFLIACHSNRNPGVRHVQAYAALSILFRILAVILQEEFLLEEREAMNPASWSSGCPSCPRISCSLTADVHTARSPPNLTILQYSSEQTSPGDSHSGEVVVVILNILHDEGFISQKTLDRWHPIQAPHLNLPNSNKIKACSWHKNFPVRYSTIQYGFWSLINQQVACGLQYETWFRVGVRHQELDNNGASVVLGKTSTPRYSEIDLYVFGMVPPKCHAAIWIWIG